MDVTILGGHAALKLRQFTATRAEPDTSCY